MRAQRPAQRSRGSRRPWAPSAALCVAVALVAALPAVPAGADPARGSGLACPNPTADAFGDDNASVHEPAINCMSRWGVASGTSNGAYSPEGNVGRDQTASFVVRLMRTAGYSFDSAPADQFDDDDGNVHETSINQLAAAKVITGTGPRRFSPSRDVTRGQMAALLNRALSALRAGEAASHEHFTDDDGVFEGDINALASLGIVEGTGSGLYSPGRTVRRAPMAAFLARTADRLADRGSLPTSTGAIKSPAGFAAAQGEGPQVLLTWTPSEDIRVDFYFIQFAESVSGQSCQVLLYSFAEQLDGRSTASYTHRGQTGRAYCYRLRAVDQHPGETTQTDAPAVFAGPVTVD